MLGTNYENPSLRWAKATAIQDIDASAIHGHIFVLKENQLQAYEYQQGPLPDLSGASENFLPEFVDYIVKNNLTTVIGLQVLGHCEIAMSELILYQGTVMLDSSVVQNTTPTRTSG